MEKLNAFLEPHLEPLRPHVEPFVDELKAAAKPLTDKLPEGVQHFLEEGGWYWILGILLVVFLIWLFSVVRRLFRALFGSAKHKDPKWAKELREDLDELPMPSEPSEDHILAVKGIKARLRLVVLAQAGKNVDLSKGMAPEILELVMPGLGDICKTDDPKVRIWPAQFSYDGFALAFLNHVRSPDAPGDKSHWILLAGMLQVSKKKTHVGLALWTEKATTIGRVKLKSQGFTDVLRIKELKQR